MKKSRIAIKVKMAKILLVLAMVASIPISKIIFSLLPTYYSLEIFMSTPLWCILLPIVLSIFTSGVCTLFFWGSPEITNEYRKILTFNGSYLIYLSTFWTIKKISNSLFSPNIGMKVSTTNLFFLLISATLFIIWFSDICIAIAEIIQRNRVSFYSDLFKIFERGRKSWKS